MIKPVSSEKIDSKWVVIIKVPHEEDSRCSAFLDSDIGDNYWFPLYELVFLLEVEEQKDLSEASRSILTIALKELIPETGLQEYSQTTVDMESWVKALREAVNLVDEHTPESGLEDDFGHSRLLIQFLDQHSGCSEKLVFALMFGW